MLCKSSALSALVVVFLSVLLASCGGGGNGSTDGVAATPTGSPASSPGASTVVALSFDATVPVATRNTVAAYVSPKDESSFPSVGVPDAPESLLLALNANGDMLLAAMGRGKDVVFTAESTAVALVRILLATNTPEGAPLAVDQIIRNAAGYTNLLSATQKSLQIGSPVSRDQTVVESAYLVALQVVSSQTVAASANTTLDAKPLSVTKPSLAAPYKLYSYASLPKTTYVQAISTTSEDISLRNTMSIAWSVDVNDSNKASLYKSGLLLPNTNFLIISGLASDDSVAPSSFKAPGGKSVDVRLYQSSASLADTTAGIGSRFINYLFKVSGSGFAPCTEVIVKQGIKIIIGSAFDDQSKSPGDILWSALQPTGVIDLVKSCSGQTLNKKFVAALGIAALLKAADPLKDAFLIPGQIIMMVGFRNYDVTTGVCRSFSGQIANCVDKFNFSPGFLSMMVGAKIVDLDSHLSPVDANGKATLKPKGYFYSTEAKAAVLTQSTDGADTFFAYELGSNAILVTDDATAAKGRLPVKVSRAVISPATLTVKPGDDARFELRDSSGLPIIQPDSGQYPTKWESSDPSVLVSSLGSAQPVFKAVKSGPAIVTATNGYTGSIEASAAVTVSGNTGYWSINFDMKTCGATDWVGTWSTPVCNVTGGWAGNSGGKIYLSPSSGTTSFNALVEVNNGGVVQRPKVVQFAPDSVSYSVVFRWANTYSGISFDQQVPVNFSIASSVPFKTMSGTFLGTAPYLHQYDITIYGSKTDVQVAAFTGTWSANWVADGTIPFPTFKVPGDFCFFGTGNFNISQVDNLPQNVGSQGTINPVGSCIRAP